MSLASSIIVAILLFQPPPPTPHPITGTLPISLSIMPYLTPISYTVQPTQTMDLHLVENFKGMLPLAVTILGASTSIDAIGTILMWRIGVLGLMFVFDFVLGKLGRTLSSIQIQPNSKLAKVRTGIRSAREMAAYGRKISGRRGR